MTRWHLHLATVLVLALEHPIPLDASGSYRAPMTQVHSTVDREQLVRGETLFQQTGALQTITSCAECHDREATVPLRRSSLRRQENSLLELMALCLNDKARSAALRIMPSGDARVIDLGVYLIARYRLNVKAMTQFQENSAGVGSP